MRASRLVGMSESEFVREIAKVSGAGTASAGLPGSAAT